MIAAIYARKSLIGVLILALVLAAPSLTAAEGAWVLWVNASGGLHPPPPGDWHVLEGYGQLEECRKAAAANAQGKRRQILEAWAGLSAIPQPGKTPEQTRAENAEIVREVDSHITVSGGHFEQDTMSGTPMVFDYVCLPGTVDPRGPKK